MKVLFSHKMLKSLLGGNIYATFWRVPFHFNRYDSEWLLPNCIFCCSKFRYSNLLFLFVLSGERVSLAFDELGFFANNQKQGKCQFMSCYGVQQDSALICSSNIETFSSMKESVLKMISTILLPHLWQHIIIIIKSLCFRTVLASNKL